MKKFLAMIVLSCLLVCAGGCQTGSAPAGETKSYSLMGKQVSLVAPPSPWVEELQKVGESEMDMGHDTDTVVGITFSKPDDQGLMAVGAVAQQRAILEDDKGQPKRDKNGNIEFGDYIALDQDQETLNQIAMWVEKRDGDRIKEEWITVLGSPAFHMIFEVGSGSGKRKGEQVHFVHDHYHYTLSILVPPGSYDEEVAHFRRLVESFQVTEKS